ncbi:MAG: GGDEF domain-containing protein [Mariprofundaceae bacterium]|nr:GGDEF domain-containing protein [Mariprofundaceae bacterium]
MLTKNNREDLKRLRDDPSRVVILGGGRGGSAMLETLFDEVLVDIVAVVDLQEDAPGILLAKQRHIATFTDVATALIASAPCVAFNLTDNEMVEEVAANILGVGGVIGGLEARLMWRMVTDLKAAKKDLEFQATHDVLTNLVNRRFMVEQVEQEVERCRRYDMQCSVIMLDLDHFKQVNDEHGHAAGDEVLKGVTCIIAEQLRSADILARWGGEEFLILLPHTDKKAALSAAEKCLSAVQGAELDVADAVRLQMSFSAGVASFSELKQGLSTTGMVDALLAISDRRLYAAKSSGRGQVAYQD